MPAGNESAPFKKDPEFVRDSFLRPPDWRWQEARKLVDEELYGIPTVSESWPLILYAARLQKAFRNISTREYIRVKMPETWHVIVLGSQSSSSKLKAALEACIICGLNAEEIQEKLKWIRALPARLYMDLFCDLTGVQGIAEWFEQMMLSPIRDRKSMTLFKARALAHYWSLEAALHSLRFGNPGKSAKVAMDLMWRNQRNAQVFEYIAKTVNVPPQVYMQSMQQAVKGREDRDFIIESRAEETGSSETVAPLIQGLEQSVRNFTEAEIKEAEKDKIGLDFASGYIAQITNKNVTENGNSKHT